MSAFSFRPAVRENVSLLIGLAGAWLVEERFK